MRWPTSIAELSAVQAELASASPDPWQAPNRGLDVGGVFVCFGRGGSGPGARGDDGWGGAAVVRRGRTTASATVRGVAGGPYRSGYLALRDGPLLELSAQALGPTPELILVNATGRDHPRRAGLALHLGAVLGIPTVGVTHRPLLAGGDWPDSSNREATAPLRLGSEVVGYWVRTRADCRPLAVHAAWRTSPETAREMVLSVATNNRTPEPLREARRLARTARSSS